MSRDFMIYGLLISMSVACLAGAEGNRTLQVACGVGIIASHGLSTEMDKARTPWPERLIFFAVFAGLGLGAASLWQGR
jgi:hypothetical protein